jgi:hypothetical protein
MVENPPLWLAVIGNAKKYSQTGENIKVNAFRLPPAMV